MRILTPTPLDLFWVLHELAQRKHLTQSLAHGITWYGGIGHHEEQLQLYLSKDVCHPLWRDQRHIVCDISDVPGVQIEGDFAVYRSMTAGGSSVGKPDMSGLFPRATSALCGQFSTKQLNNDYENLKIIKRAELGDIIELRLFVLKKKNLRNKFHDLLHCMLYFKNQASIVSWFGIRHGKQPFYVKLFPLPFMFPLLRHKFTVAFRGKRKGNSERRIETGKET